MHLCWRMFVCRVRLRLYTQRGLRVQLNVFTVRHYQTRLHHSTRLLLGGRVNLS